MRAGWRRSGTSRPERTSPLERHSADPKLIAALSTNWRTFRFRLSYATAAAPPLLRDGN